MAVCAGSLAYYAVLNWTALNTEAGEFSIARRAFLRCRNCLRVTYDTKGDLYEYLLSKIAQAGVNG
jgi:hypothetical protein